MADPDVAKPSGVEAMPAPPRVRTAQAGEAVVGGPGPPPGFAITATVLGVVGLLLGLTGLAPAALVLGTAALGMGFYARRRDDGRRQGFAVAAIVLGVLGIGVFVLSVVLFFVTVLIMAGAFS